jgi:4-amino-4-deoxy-L-arabinose transferase-like glycosyltransferase
MRAARRQAETAATAHAVSLRSYAILLGLAAAILLSAHLPWIGLPYFWDEAGFYVPAALDVFHGGWLIPHSVPPLIHPPGVPTYLAAAWSLAGFHPETTRCAMLLLAAAAVLAAFLLAIELLSNVPGMPAFLTAGLLCLSPVFFTQSLMAQLDMPAMLFTTVALWFFLRDRIPEAAIACIALVSVKETGLVAPVAFAGWLIYERRWRDAAWFLAPMAALAGWIVILYRVTGHWTGSPGFVDYNLFYPLHPLRFGFNALRRIYYLFFANLHWIGTVAVLFAWRTTRIFRTRSWRIAGLFAVAHVGVVTALGGATLERYLLPVLPILYAAMTAGLWSFPRRPRLICSAALAAGLAAGIFVNPPYPFPYENNLAFTDFVHLQTEAADYLKRWYPAARVTTIWPLTTELARPEDGYFDRRMKFDSLPDLSPETLAHVDWKNVQVLAAFSRKWDPPLNPLRYAPLSNAWSWLFGYNRYTTEEELWNTVPFPAAVHWQRNGQWLDIYVNPRLPAGVSGPQLRATR